MKTSYLVSLLLVSVEGVLLSVVKYEMFALKCVKGFLRFHRLPIKCTFLGFPLLKNWQSTNEMRTTQTDRHGKGGLGLPNRLKLFMSILKCQGCVNTGFESMRCDAMPILWRNGIMVAT